MSGSLVWNTTRFVECILEDKEWTPGYADVAGTIWFWSEGEAIGATRVEYIRSFLLRVVARLEGDRAQAESSDQQEPPA
jgi:hypothetical protein